MKKLLALLLTLTLVSLSAFALAEGDPAAEPGETAEPAQTLELDRNTMTGTTEVSLTVDRSMDSYTVVIPSKVTIDPKTQYGYGDVVLKAGWELVSVNSLKVQLSGAENGILSGSLHTSDSYRTYNPSDLALDCFQNFKLKSENHEVSYSLKASTLAWPFSTSNNSNVTGSYYYYRAYNTSMISVSKGGNNEEDKICNLTFYVKTMPADPGIYTYTLTFSIITQ